MPPAWEPDRPAAHRRQFPTLTDAQRRALWAREHGYTGALDADGYPTLDAVDERTDPAGTGSASGLDDRASAGADLGGAA